MNSYTFGRVPFLAWISVIAPALSHTNSNSLLPSTPLLSQKNTLKSHAFIYYRLMFVWEIWRTTRLSNVVIGRIWKFSFNYWYFKLCQPFMSMPKIVHLRLTFDSWIEQFFLISSHDWISDTLAPIHIYMLISWIGIRYKFSSVGKVCSMRRYYI